MLCTSCTVSYIFAELLDLDTTVGEEVQLKFDPDYDAVPANFVNLNLQMYADDDAQTPYSFNMDVAFIDPFYASPQYFTNYQENVLGLAPMGGNDPDMLRRQFLYQFTHSDQLKD